MKCNITSKIKGFLIAVVVILLAGAVVFGVFGLNTAPDYKDGYELNVSVDANIGKASEVLRTATDDYLASKGVSYASYDLSTIDNGGILMIRFSEDISQKISLTELETAVETAMQSSEILKGIDVTAKIYERKDYVANNALWLPIGLGIALVVAFVYVSIAHKIQGGVAVFAVSLLASMIFASIMTISRLPVKSFFLPSIIATAVLSAIFSLSIVARCSNVLKNSGNDKIAYSAIAEENTKAVLPGMIIATLSILVFAIAIAVLGASYLKFLGVQVAISAISACVTALFLTGVLWSKLKPYSKKRSENVQPSKEEK